MGLGFETQHNAEVSFGQSDSGILKLSQTKLKSVKIQSQNPAAAKRPIPPQSLRPCKIHPLCPNLETVSETPDENSSCPKKTGLIEVELLKKMTGVTLFLCLVFFLSTNLIKTKTNIVFYCLTF